MACSLVKEALVHVEGFDARTVASLIWESLTVYCVRTLMEKQGAHRGSTAVDNFNPCDSSFDEQY